MKWANAATVALIAASFLLSIIAYPHLPERMASHWGAGGEVNGYMPKDVMFLLLPAMTLVFAALLRFLPSIDPLKANVAAFMPEYERFIAVFASFMLYIQALTIAWNLGVAFDMMTALAPAFAILYYRIGVLLGQTKQNWWIGVRVPWTLSSPAVWEKTHRLGGRLFKASGVIALTAPAFGQYGIIPVIAPILASTAYLTFYSWREYQNEKKQNPGTLP